MLEDERGYGEKSPRLFHSTQGPNVWVSAIKPNTKSWPAVSWANKWQINGVSSWEVKHYITVE